MKAAKAEFVQSYPQYKDDEIKCRNYDDDDRYSEAMGSELQGYV